MHYDFQFSLQFVDIISIALRTVIFTNFITFSFNLYITLTDQTDKLKSNPVNPTVKTDNKKLAMYTPRQCLYMAISIRQMQGGMGNVKTEIVLSG